LEYNVEPGRRQRLARKGAAMSRGTIEIAELDGGLVNLGSEQLEELDLRVEGRLLRAEDEGWNDAVLVWSTQNYPHQRVG
jgi:hypothetical protein